VKVHTSLLIVAANNLSCLASFKGSVGVQLVLREPFSGDGVHARWRGMRVQVPLPSSTSYSSCIAWCQSGSRRASRTVVGGTDGVCTTGADLGDANDVTVAILV
jgi:hypothetical protein